MPRLDADGRFRSTYSPYADTGRFRSGSSPLGTGCVLPLAEVLTLEGWKKISILDKSDLVAQYDLDTHEIDFCTPKILSYEYKGDMIVAQSWFHRATYTPEHRILYRHPVKGERGRLMVAKSSQVAKMRYVRIPVGGFYSGGTKFKLIRLLVATQADGSVEGTSIRFTFKKKRKIDRLIWLCESNGIRLIEQTAKEGYRRFSINKEHSTAIIELLTKEKRYDSWLLHFDANTLDAFLDEFKYWDGAGRVDSTVFSTIIKSNAEWVTTIAHLRGWHGSYNVHSNRRKGSYGEFSARPIYCVNLAPSSEIVSQRNHYSKVQYSGMVWCLQVPTTFFLLRQNNRIVITGNSNGQNVDRETRDIYLPDDGCIFFGCDLSTAEDRITKVRTKSPRLIERARRPPWEWDEHRYTASVVYRKPAQEVSGEERYAAKKFRHGSNYGEQAQKISDVFLTEGYIITAEECQTALDKILRDDPEILEYQRNIRRELMASRKLRTAWGREIDFSYERMNDDLYRRGYAYRPQSECADLLNMWGFKPLAKYLREHPVVKAKINQQGHDSLLISVVPEHAYLVAVLLQASLERPVDYDGVGLTIPVTFALGTTWKFEKEFRCLPSRKEFTDIAHSLWEKIKCR